MIWCIVLREKEKTKANSAQAPVTIHVESAYKDFLHITTV